MKILYQTRDLPWGGGNQFLKALAAELQKRGPLTPSSVVLINSHQLTLSFTLICACLNPSYRILHRVDGPVSTVRGKGSDLLDKLIYLLSTRAADGVIFQSQWSLNTAQSLGFFPQTPKVPTRIILNAPDPTIFNTLKRTRSRRHSSEPISVIYCSWSSSPKKGSSSFLELADRLSHKNFKFTFVGNLPPTAHSDNVRVIKPVISTELSDLLQQQDVYLSFSQDDPCSNALIEAIACGCYPLVYSSGGNIEIVEQFGGLIFSNSEEASTLLLSLSTSMLNSKSMPSLTLTVSEYLQFSSMILNKPIQHSPLERLIVILVTIMLLKIKTLYPYLYSLFRSLKNA